MDDQAGIPGIATAHSPEWLVACAIHNLERQYYGLVREFLMMAKGRFREGALTPSHSEAVQPAQDLTKPIHWPLPPPEPASPGCEHQWSPFAGHPRFRYCLLCPSLMMDARVYIPITPDPKEASDGK